MATTTDTYDANAIWTCPAGVTSALFKLWGAGSSGGVNAAGEGGGAGGDYAEITRTVVPASAYTLQVGIPDNQNGSGGDFTADAFGDSILFDPAVSATQGVAWACGAALPSGRVGAAAGTAANSHGDVVHTGGGGGTSTNAGSGGGGGGGSGGSTGNGGNGGATSTATAGTAGTAGAGGGAVGGAGGANLAAGVNGVAPGGGGGGGGAGANHGLGAAGRITVTYTLPAATLTGGIGGRQRIGRRTGRRFGFR